jgi:hypothetical protein
MRICTKASHFLGKIPSTPYRRFDKTDPSAPSGCLTPDWCDFTTTNSMQLDIFEHSRDVTLRNAVIDALMDRHVASTMAAIDDLVSEYSDDAMLPALNLLAERLALRVVGPLNRASAGDVLRATENVIPAAQRVFGTEADSWLSPFWVELATAVTALPFDPRDETLHAVPLLLRAGKWNDACLSLDSIPSWRRQPAPLSWKIEATARIDGVDAIWPFFAELSWMAARRAEKLADHLGIAELNKLVRSFNVEFDGDGMDNDFAYFPAWVLITNPQLADRFQGTQAGANTSAERCARLVLHLLVLERRGRHTDVAEGRKKLRDTHHWLFERYLRTRR